MGKIVTNKSEAQVDGSIKITTTTVEDQIVDVGFIQLQIDDLNQQIINLTALLPKK